MFVLDDYLNKNLVFCKIAVQNKEELFVYLSEIVDKNYHIPSGNILECLKERESCGSTGIGNGVAIPHARVKSAKDFIIIAATLKNAIPFDSFDGKDVKLVLMIIVPDAKNLIYLKLLSHIATAFNNVDNIKRIVDAKNEDEILEIIRSLD